MKIKMPCKLCELSLDQQKMSRTNCNHILDYAPPYVPFTLEQLAMQSNGLLLPQMRDMMLAACLLRGKLCKEEEERSVLMQTNQDGWGWWHIGSCAWNKNPFNVGVNCCVVIRRMWCRRFITDNFVVVVVVDEIITVYISTIMIVVTGSHKQTFFSVLLSWWWSRNRIFF